MIENAGMVDLAPNLKVGIARPEDLLVMKVLAGRDRDMEDARRLVELFPNLDKGSVEAQLQEFAEALEQPEMLARMESVLKA